MGAQFEEASQLFLGASEIKAQDSNVLEPTDKLIQDQGYTSLRVTRVTKIPAAAVTNDGRPPAPT